MHDLSLTLVYFLIVIIFVTKYNGSWDVLNTLYEINRSNQGKSSKLDHCGAAFWSEVVEFLSLILMALEPSEEEKIRSLIKLFLHWNNGVVFALHKRGATRFKLGGWDFSKRLSLNCILYIMRSFLQSPPW